MSKAQRKKQALLAQQTTTQQNNDVAAVENDFAQDQMQEAEEEQSTFLDAAELDGSGVAAAGPPPGGGGAGGEDPDDGRTDAERAKLAAIRAAQNPSGDDDDEAASEPTDAAAAKQAAIIGAPNAGENEEESMDGRSMAEREKLAAMAGGPKSNPEEGDVDAEGGKEEQAAKGTEKSDEEANPQEKAAEEGASEGEAASKGEGKGAEADGPNGGDKVAAPRGPRSATRAPATGVSRPSQIGSPTVDEDTANHVLKETGRTPDQHRQAAQGHVDTLIGSLEGSQVEQVALADQLSAETVSTIDSTYTGLIQGAIASVIGGIGGAYQSAIDRVNTVSGEVRGSIDAAEGQAIGNLTTSVSGAQEQLAGSIASARESIVAMQAEWAAPFTGIEEARAAEFAQAADAAGQTLLANKDAMAAEKRREGNELEQAKGELEEKAAKKVIQQDAENIIAQGPVEAQEAITALGHASIVQGWLNPLIARVDQAELEGSQAIDDAGVTALGQIETDAESSRTQVDTDRAAAQSQLELDRDAAQTDAEAAGEQLEADLATELGDIDALFTDTSADIADSYRIFSDGVAASLDSNEFLSEEQAMAFVAEQEAAADQLVTSNEDQLTTLRDTTVSGVSATLDAALEAFEAILPTATTEANAIADQKAGALRGIGESFTRSLDITAQMVDQTVQIYLDPIGVGLEEYTASVEAQLQTEVDRVDADLGTQLGVYQGELDAEVAAFAENIDVADASAGLEETLRSICSDAWSAMRGWGTDEDKLFNALRKIETPAGGAAAEWMWPRVHSGASGVRRTLRGFARDDLDNGEYAIATAYLDGDRARGAQLELEDNMNWYGDDEEQIEAILRSLDDEERTAMQQLDGWENTAAELQDNLGGTDLDVTDALLANNEARADAYRLRDSIDEARRDGDDDALHTALAGMDPSRREQIAQEFTAIQSGIEASQPEPAEVDQDDAYAALLQYSTREVQTHGYDSDYSEEGSYDRRTGLRNDSVTGASYDLTAALITEGNDSMSADVARFEIERQRNGGPDEENMETALMMSDAERAILRDPDHERYDEVLAAQESRASDFNEAWQAQYGEQDGAPANVSEAIGDMYEDADNSELEVEAHQAMLEDGTNSARVVAMVTELSVDGAGTNEERMERMWNGMTPQEADEAQEIWARDYGEDGETLEDRLFGGTFSEMSGDEAREQRIRMLGDSQYFEGEYADRHMQVAQLEYEGSQSAGSGLAGDESRSLEINYGLLEDHLAAVATRLNADSAFDADGRFIGNETEYARYTELCAIVGINASLQRERMDSIVSAITTAIAIIGAVVAIILTAGAAAPAVAAISAGVALGTGAATMGANYLLLGGRYGWEQAAVDLGVTALSAATAGAGSYLSASGRAAGAMGSKFAGDLAVGMGSAFINTTGSTMMQDDTWNNGFWEGMGTSVGNGLQSTVVAGVSSTISARFSNSRLGQSLSRRGTMLADGTNKAIGSGLGGMGGEVANIGMDVGFRGQELELDEMGERVATSGGNAALSGFFEGAAEGHMERRVAAQAELDAAEESYNAAEEETADQLQQQDEQAAQEMQELNENAKDQLAVDEASGEVVDTEGPEQVQGDLNEMESTMESNDQEVLDAMQDEVQDVQNALDEVEAIDAQIESELANQEGTEQGTEVSRTSGGSEESSTSSTSGGGDDSAAYEQEQLLMALVDLEAAGETDAMDFILSHDDLGEALAAAERIIPTLRGDDGANQDFVTHGTSVDEMTSTPQGEATFEAMVQEAMIQDPSIDRPEAVRRMTQQVESGVEPPQQFGMGEGQTLYKVVPEGSTKGLEYTPFWMTESELALVSTAPDQLADYLGLPAGSIADSYDVYEISVAPGQSAEVFAQEIAPVTEQAAFRNGGGDQILVPNRTAWTPAAKVDTIDAGGS